MGRSRKYIHRNNSVDESLLSCEIGMRILNFNNAGLDKKSFAKVSLNNFSLTSKVTALWLIRFITLIIFKKDHALFAHSGNHSDDVCNNNKYYEPLDFNTHYRMKIK